MRTSSHLIQYLVAAVIVVMLGGLAGWYVFVHGQISATQAIDAARGFGTAASFGSASGGSYANSSGFPGGSASGTTTGSSVTPAPRLWKVVNAPVAGIGFAASSSRLYLAERATGNVLEADPAQSSVVRLTNTLFPKIYEALFAPDGSVLLRSQTDGEVITTFAGKIASTTEGAPVALEGVYLPQNIVSAAVRSSRQILLLIADPRGGSVGVTTNWAGTSQKHVFASLLSGWRTWWLSDGVAYFSQKPSDDVSGYAFRMKNTDLQSLVSGPGLSILPRPGSTALIYSTSGGGGRSLFVQASASSSPVRLPIQTIAEKCVWAPGRDLVAYCAVPQVSPATSAYLREWYQGTLHTADAWWRIDVSAGSAAKLFTPDAGLSLDVENPATDEGGTYIAFINASDDLPWMLRITP